MSPHGPVALAVLGLWAIDGAALLLVVSHNALLATEGSRLRDLERSALLVDASTRRSLAFTIVCEGTDTVLWLVATESGALFVVV